MEPAPAFADDPGPLHPQKGWSSWSTGKKLVVVALVSVALFILGSVAAVGFGFYWVISKGDQIATEVVVGPDSQGFLVFDGDLQDEGLSAMVERLTDGFDTALRRQREDSLPEGLRFIAGLQGSSSETVFEAVLPRSISVSSTPSGTEEPVAVVMAVNLRAYGGVIKLLFSQFADGLEGGGSDVEHTEYRGYPVIGSSDLHLARAGTSLLVATTGHTLERALDRVHEGGERMQPSAPLLSAFDSIRGEFDLRGVLKDPNGIRGVLSPDPGMAEPERLATIEQAMSHVEHARLGIDAVDEDRVRGEMAFLVDDHEFVAAIEDAVSLQEAHYRAVANQAELDLTAKRRVEARTVIVEFEIKGVSRIIDRFAISALGTAAELEQ